VRCSAQNFPLHLLHGNGRKSNCEHPRAPQCAECVYISGTSAISL